MQIQRTNNNKPAFGCQKCEEAKKIIIEHGNTKEAADKYVRTTEEDARKATSTAWGRLNNGGAFTHEKFAQGLLTEVKKMFGVK